MATEKETSKAGKVKPKKKMILAEYKKVCDQALAEYKKVCRQAYAEYRKVCRQAWAKYEKEADE